MKKTILILLAALTMTSCYKTAQPAIDPGPATVNSSGSSSGSSSGGSGGSNVASHECGYITQKGTPCKRRVSDASGYCWQHK